MSSVMWTRWLAVLFSLGISAALVAAQSDRRTEQDLLQLEQVWNDAHLHGDAAALDRLWAADLVVTVPGMAVMTRADVMAVVRMGRMKFDRYESSDTQIHVYGDAAVVTGRVQRTRTINARTVQDDWLFTKTYVRRNGRWQVVAFHASLRPE